MVPDVSCYIRSRCVAERMISCVKLVDITQNIKARTAMRKGGQPAVREGHGLAPPSSKRSMFSKSC